MKGLILNSGIGKRMGDLTKTKNKCMAEIQDGITILDRQLNLLERNGITDIVITTGPFAKELEEYVTKKYVDINFEFVFNPKYDSTNYIYSIHLADDKLRGNDIVFMHGDLVFDRKALEKVLESSDNVMVVDTTLPLPEKDFKAVVNNDKITKVGIDFFDSAYEAQPLYKIRNSDWDKWLDKIKEFCESDNVNVYAENALNEITDEINLLPLDLKGILCAEVDNVDDLYNIREKLRLEEI